MQVDVKELEIADYDILENIKAAFYRLWKMKLFVVLATLIGCCVALIYVGIVGIHTNYYASASIYSVVYGSYSESTSGVTVMNTYSGMLGTTRVCERAAEKLGEYGISVTQLRNMVNNGNIYLSGASKDSKSYGYNLSLRVSSASPEHIAEIANAMASAYADEINDLLGTSSLQVLDEAQGYSTVSSIDVKLYLLMFAAVGFVLSAGIIFVKEFFSSRVYTVAQCEADKDLILGLIPYSERKR
ncbi:MAG: hypothetical protein MR442_09500 [Lachnospiraceae bacterium]|nr:hypothetical protein [Lachnospiraceae bacterium]